MRGKLDRYVLIEPGFYSWGADHPATDQHPGHDMAQGLVYDLPFNQQGERFIKEVYELIRNSQYWTKSAILITYDEHGGYFDHVPPPMVGVPNPDGLNSTGPVHFAFDRFDIQHLVAKISGWVREFLQF